MAFSPSEVEQFIEALRDDPGLRDRVRNAILADDFLALPGIVRQLSERVDALTERMDALTERMDALTQRVDVFFEAMTALVARVDRIADNIETMNGRLGNLEGWRYEFQYRDNLASHLAPRFRRVIPGNFEPLLDAFDAGLLNGKDWHDAMQVDVLAHVREGREETAPEVYLAIELSVLVSVDDVRRAHRRAGLIERAGVPARGCVDGDAILPEARSLAEQLGVEVLVFDIAA